LIKTTFLGRRLLGSICCLSCIELCLYKTKHEECGKNGFGVRGGRLQFEVSGLFALSLSHFISVNVFNNKELA